MNMAGVSMREELIQRACSLAMKAHTLSSSSKPYLYEYSRISSSSSSEVIFGFGGSGDLSDWFTRKPFGAAQIDLDLFPSLRTIGSNQAAIVNEAFLSRFQAILANSSLKYEVEKAFTEGKQIVFTGHSSAAPIAIFATLWFLEIKHQTHPSQIPPHCLTFGSPLVGDQILSHALKRQRWSQYFTHFITKHDIVPRISLTPLSSIERELQPIIHFFDPKFPFFMNESLVRTSEALMFFLTITRNVSTVATHVACKFMGCTNLLLENLTHFIELSPYRPFGTYVFGTSNGRLVIVQNPDAVLQLLFYCLQSASEGEWAEVVQRSFKEHLMYESELIESFPMEGVAYLNNLEDLPLTAEDIRYGPNSAISAALNDLALSTRARLCLRAAGELEKQKSRNQSKIESNKNKIQNLLNMLQSYQANCEVRKVGYYDAFKIQRHTEDFNNNIRRLELAGIWDEIIEMLKRNELPDEFEGQKEWNDLGTRYRRLVEPLDIANYYRHLKNEDTGPYMGKARPSRYRYTQKWQEHAERTEVDPLPESCFWAEVEELVISTCNGESFEDVEERILNLERKVSRWVRSGLLGKDVFLKESTFVQWWKRLPIEHRSVSCIKDLLHL